MSCNLSAYVNVALAKNVKKKAVVQQELATPSPAPSPAPSAAPESVRSLRPPPLSFREPLTGEKTPAPAVLPPINELPAPATVAAPVAPAPAEAQVVPSSEEGSWVLVKGKEPRAPKARRAQKRV